MKRIVSLAVATAILAPMAFGGGIGLVVPIGLGYSQTIDGKYGGSADRDVGSYVGFGIAWDNNLGKDVLVNKRITIEYSSQSVKYTGRAYTGTSDNFTVWNIASYYGFGVLRNENFRLSIGPRINVQYAKGETHLTADRIDDFEIGIGIAPAISFNWNINKSLTLSADLDYKFQYTFGDLSSNLYYEERTYDSTMSDITARLYVMYRFGESNSNYSGEYFDEPQGDNQATTHDQL